MDPVDRRTEAAHALGAIRFPPELPVSARADELIDAIASNQVLVVAGETGSGKSTQLPKLAIAAGRGRSGLIGHTQPRRIAARAVAERVADELGVKLGTQVGYTVRFTDEVTDQTLVKVMTDGILLAEIGRDPDLKRYDTIIIDEAHERSLNIDFLLGYLHRLRARRPDLAIIITSATIDTERFAEHFASPDGTPAPIIEVSGRTYPVDIEYRPFGDDDDGDPDGPRNQADAIAAAVSGIARGGDGDVLVFCSGEREIADAARAIDGLELPSLETLPLYARLSASEQHRIFAPHRGRRVVIATNIAETSLTVPGIRWVIDAGTARISRVSARTKVQRLPIEEISQASANQRSGRAGRLAPGTAIRLYSEDNFNQRPEFTEPEILRTGLASVILQMASLGLGEVSDFPFLDPPDPRQIRAGVALLAELGAVDETHAGTPKWLTPVGRSMARLPIDPRLARAVVAAGDLGCVAEVVIIAAALSIQDPRERPAEQRQAADEAHQRFADPSSDLLAYLNLWRWVNESRRSMSNSAFRRRCRTQFLHYLRIREWQDVERQVRRLAADAGFKRGRGHAHPDLIHQALLHGFVGQIGHKASTDKEFRGPRNTRFVAAPDSVFFKKSPRWVMAAELVETNRLWGRGVAKIQPEWVEDAAPHLVTIEHGEVWWDPNDAEVMAIERVRFGNLTLVGDRAVPYRRIDPAFAREWFIHNALVEGDWEAPHAFLVHNATVRADAAEQLTRSRQRTAAVSDTELAAWFAERIPDHITGGRSFEKWWKRRRSKDKHFLDLRLDEVVDPAHLDPNDFPDTWQQGDLSLEVSYEFDPTTAGDGVVIEVPVEVALSLDPAPFGWQVPGHRVALLEGLLRTLPKDLRRPLMPLSDTATELAQQFGPDDGPVDVVVADHLARTTGLAIGPHSFSTQALPPHLVPTFQVHDARGIILAEGTDLASLAAATRTQCRAALVRAVARSGGPTEQSGLTDWPGDIGEFVNCATVAGTVSAYPALVDEGDTVGVRILPTADEAARQHQAGLQRLLRLQTRVPARALKPLLTTEFRLALPLSPYDSAADWAADATDAAIGTLLSQWSKPVHTTEQWRALQEFVETALTETAMVAARHAAEVVERNAQVRIKLGGDVPTELAADIEAQLDRLVYPGFAAAAGDHLERLGAYLQAMEYRLGRAERNDAERLAVIHTLERRYEELLATIGWSAELEALGWDLEELRIAQLAQPIGAAATVSPKRLARAMAAMAQQRITAS